MAGINKSINISNKNSSKEVFNNACTLKVDICSIILSLCLLSTDLIIGKYL